MSIVGDIVARLIAAGTPPDVAAIAVTEAFAAGARIVESPVENAESPLERRRAWDRERKRKNRVENAEIPPEKVEIPPEMRKTPLTYLSKINNTKKESKKERACRIPPEWKPSQFDSDFALSKGMPRERTATEAEKFRNYWLAKSGSSATKLDWTATWRNWVLQSLERVPGNPPAAPIDKPPEWKKPPWEREGITEAAWRERELGKINGTQIRRDAGMGKNGADRSTELPLSGGGALRDPRVQTRDASDDFP